MPSSWPQVVSRDTPDFDGDGTFGGLRVEALGRQLTRGSVADVLASANRPATANGPCAATGFPDAPAGAPKYSSVAVDRAARAAGIGSEDLSYWPARDELWTVTEHAGRRMLHGVGR